MRRQSMWMDAQIFHGIAKCVNGRSDLNESMNSKMCQIIFRYFKCIVHCTYGIKTFSDSVFFRMTVAVVLPSLQLESSSRAWWEFVCAAVFLHSHENMITLCSVHAFRQLCTISWNTVTDWLFPSHKRGKTAYTQIIRVTYKSFGQDELKKKKQQKRFF